MSGDPTESGERQAPAGPPSAANPADVSIDAFVSYASHDAPVANSIVEALEKHGLRCWIAPRDVTPGSHYADHIMSAISRAKVLVLVLRRRTRLQARRQRGRTRLVQGAADHRASHRRYAADAGFRVFPE